MEKVINCQHCQERIKGGAIQIFLNKETVSENKFNELFIYLHDNKKCRPEWEKVNKINYQNYLFSHQAFISWDGRIDAPIKY